MKRFLFPFFLFASSLFAQVDIDGGDIASGTVADARIASTIARDAEVAAAYQPLDAALTSISGLTTAANKGIYTSALDTYATYDLTAAGRALAGVAGTANTFPYFSASNVASLASVTAAGLAILDDADATAQRATLGLVIGTNVLAPNGVGSALTAINADNISSGTLAAARLPTTITQATTFSAATTTFAASGLGANLLDFTGSATVTPFGISMGNAVETIWKRGGFIGMGITVDATTGLPEVRSTNSQKSTAIGFGNYGITDGNSVSIFSTTSSTAGTDLTELARFNTTAATFNTNVLVSPTFVLAFRGTATGPRISAGGTELILGGRDTDGFLELRPRAESTTGRVQMTTTAWTLSDAAMTVGSGTLNLGADAAGTHYTSSSGALTRYRWGNDTAGYYRWALSGDSNSTWGFGGSAAGGLYLRASNGAGAALTTSTSNQLLFYTGATPALAAILSDSGFIVQSATAPLLHVKATADTINPVLRWEGFNRNWYAGVVDTGSDGTFNISPNSNLSAPVLSFIAANGAPSFSYTGNTRATFTSADGLSGVNFDSTSSDKRWAIENRGTNNSGQLWISGGSIASPVTRLTMDNSTGDTVLASTTDASSKDAASLVLEGGLAVEKAGYFGGVLSTTGGSIDGGLGDHLNLVNASGATYVTKIRTSFSASTVNNIYAIEVATGSGTRAEVLRLRGDLSAYLAGSLNVVGAALVGTISTGAPSGGSAAAWKLGEETTIGTADVGLRVQVGSSTYLIAADKL